MPTAGEGAWPAVANLLNSRGIGFHPTSRIDEIDATRHELQLSDDPQVGYGVLPGIPAHRAPEALAASGFAAESGYAPVDRHLLTTAHEGVMAIGDATTIPLADGKFMLPKAGVVAHAQAQVVAKVGFERAGGGKCIVRVGWSSGSSRDTRRP